MEVMIQVPIFDWFFLLALFPIAFFWARRAYRILIRRDFSEVALKKGMPPADPERYAHYEFVINFLPAIVLIGVLISSFLPLLWVFVDVNLNIDGWILDRDTRLQYAGVTIWLKVFASFALSRHAHGGIAALGKKKPPQDPQP
jgi:hypothetical protein